MLKRVLTVLLALSLTLWQFPLGASSVHGSSAALIAKGDVWRYFKGTSAPPSNWTARSFSDAAWSTGPSGLGYGDGDDATALTDMRYNYLSLYIRRTFTVSDPATIASLKLTMDYDDSFVAYLNGVEVARDNVAGNPPAFNSPSSSEHEASQGDLLPQPSAQFDISAFRSKLVAGSNVLAVQGHNIKVGSSDFSLIPTLTSSDSSTSTPPSSSSGTSEGTSSGGSTGFELVPVGATWQYRKGTSEPAANWKALGFDASAWPQGPSGFGYGDGDDATALSDMRYNYVSLYIRHTFTVNDPGALGSLVLRMDYDDGFVAYLNGAEVARANVAGSPPAFNTPARGDHEASRGDTSPQAPVDFDISAAIPKLVAGKNVLAIQGHNVKLGSSDFSLIPALTGNSSAATTSTASADIFRVIVVPDTEYYSEFYPQIFTAQTQWVAANAARLNIKFVIHEGDIVQHWDSDKEWQRADASMSILDEAGIPYSVVPGNSEHAGHSSTGSSSFYNAHFGPSRFSAKPWWGGSYHNNDNNYQLLTISGEGYIFISVDWCPTGDEIDWANRILSSYPNRRAILTTHAFLNDNGGTSGITLCEDTGYIWDDLIQKHANLQIVLSGHVHTGDGEAYRVSRNSAGKAVHQMLADYQEYPNGGNGWLRILEFDSSRGIVNVKTYSPYLDSYSTDSSSQFSFTYP